MASELFSWTVSSVDFPLGPRDGILVDACNDESALLESGVVCFPVFVEFAGNNAWFVGVAP